MTEPDGFRIYFGTVSDIPAMAPAVEDLGHSTHGQAAASWSKKPRNHSGPDRTASRALSSSGKLAHGGSPEWNALVEQTVADARAAVAAAETLLADANAELDALTYSVVSGPGAGTASFSGSS